LDFEIEGKPIPWAAHKGYGRRAFNPRYKEREFYQWKLRQQYLHDFPIETAVKVSVTYFMSIPTSFSKKMKEKALSGELLHVKRPDVDNLNKFLMDCIKDVVIKDDSQIVEQTAKKVYGAVARTFVEVIPLNT